VKVLFIVTAYPRWPGDVITPWLVETIERLAARGVEVEVLAPAYRGSPGGRIGGVMVHRFRYAPSGWETLTHDQTAPDRVRERPGFLALVPGYVAAGSVAAARLARTGAFDVVHAFWPLPHGLLGLAAKRAGGIPLVSTFFGVELSWLSSELGVLRPLLRRIVRRSDAITAISSHTSRALSSLAPGVQPAVIPFGAATAPSGEAGKRVRAAGSSMRLLFVGRLVERKGVHVLLRALALGGDDRLTVVGDGPQKLELEELAVAEGVGGRVTFTGSIEADELSRRFHDADALVLPALRDAKGDVEGLGVVLIEALAAGTPVIASESGGIVDIVRHEETGLLVPPGDPARLAGAIARYRDDPTLASRLAERGREHVRSDFSWDRIIDRLETLYRELAAR
jgi:glycosyltransferase involved in cell wall biosynthesis